MDGQTDRQPDGWMTSQSDKYIESLLATSKAQLKNQQQKKKKKKTKKKNPKKLKTQFILRICKANQTAVAVCVNHKNKCLSLFGITRLTLFPGVIFLFLQALDSKMAMSLGLTSSIQLRPQSAVSAVLLVGLFTFVPYCVDWFTRKSDHH